jgi:hypothetical protein
MRPPPRAFVLVATGAQYREEAVRAAKSIRATNPLTRLICYSDVAVLPDVFDDVRHIARPAFSFDDKVAALRDYTQTAACPSIFVDTDTFVASDVAELFELTTRFPISAAHASWRFSLAESRKATHIEFEDTAIPRCFPEFNTGVIAFSPSKQVERVFRNWWRCFQDYASQVDSRPTNDQASFRKALWQERTPFYVLPPEYNFRYDFPAYAGTTVKILHGRGAAPSVLAKKLNSIRGARVHVPARKQIYSHDV